MSLDFKSLDKLKKVSHNFFIWQLKEIGAYGLAPVFPYKVMEENEGILFSAIISLYGNDRK